MKSKLKLSALLIFAPAIFVRADDVLPRQPEFALYQAMLNRSPFAVASAVVAPAVAPDFARDLYVANAARSQDGDLVTIASTTDRNFKEYLSTKAPNEHGFAISDIRWSDKIGETKVTITKEGKYATLSFNQALITQPVQNPGQALANAALAPQPVLAPPPYVKPAPIPSVPPAPVVQPNAMQNRFRSRGIIQRNPAAGVPAPAPTPVPSTDDDDG